MCFAHPISWHSVGFIFSKLLTYDRVGLPTEHLMHFCWCMTLMLRDDALLCKIFLLSLNANFNFVPWFALWVHPFIFWLMHNIPLLIHLLFKTKKGHELFIQYYDDIKRGKPEGEWLVKSENASRRLTHPRETNVSI